MYGKLQMGFKNANGDPVAFTVPDPPPASPTPSLAFPPSGSNASVGDLNGRGYIDVTFAVPTGKKLDESSVTDFAPEFDVSGITLDPTQAPVKIGDNTFRYWANGAASGTVTLTPKENGWSFTDTTTGNSTGNALDTMTATFTKAPYVDVVLRPTANQTVDESTLGAGDFTFSGAGAQGVQISSTAPMHLTGTNVYRYWISGHFAYQSSDVSTNMVSRCRTDSDRGRPGVTGKRW